MRTQALLLVAVAAATAFGVDAARAEEKTTFVVVAHQGGTLALQTSQIRSVWYRPAADGKASQIRVVSPALVEAKSLEGAEADALWKRFHEGALAQLFVFVSHMDGTLGIPRDQIYTAYRADDAGKATVRLQYEGDPSGKTLSGGEAVRIWKEIAE
jgi:hypothetical protein